MYFFINRKGCSFIAKDKDDDYTPPHITVDISRQSEVDVRGEELRVCLPKEEIDNAYNYRIWSAYIPTLGLGGTI